jgi:hypothetical protein
MRQLTYVGGNTIEWWDVPEQNCRTTATQWCSRSR